MIYSYITNPVIMAIYLTIINVKKQLSLANIIRIKLDDLTLYQPLTTASNVEAAVTSLGKNI